MARSHPAARSASPTLPPTQSASAVHALVVWGQHQPGSYADNYGAELCRAATEALERAGHTVELLDLHADRFQPVMGGDEWRAYRQLEPALDDTTGRYAEALGRAEMLVFVYPTRCFGVPAALKGWLERVLVPSVAFDLDPVSRRVRGKLDHIRHLVAITTHEATWPHVKVHGDAGRRTLLWTLRLVCGHRCRSTWLALYDLDRASEGRRRRFVAEIERCLGRPAPLWTTIRPHRRLGATSGRPGGRRPALATRPGGAVHSLQLASLVSGLRHRLSRGH